jgi:DUF4097 and DUF4098 domain-containing protein YvlB
MKPMPIRLRAVALLLPALLVASAGCDIVTADFREQSTEEWRKTYELQAGGRVEVRNVNGRIEVVKGEGNVVEVVAKKTGRAASQEAAKDALQRIQIIDTTSGGVIKVETKLERSGGGLFNHSSGQVQYTVRVPADAELKLSTVNGGVEITGINGRVTAEATNGGVIGRDLGGPVEASTTNGGVDVDFAAISGDVKLECTNGGVRIRLPKDAKATISARVTNGGIDVEGVDLQTRGESTRRRLDADLNGGGARIELGGTNGGIDIRGR